MEVVLLKQAKADRDYWKSTGNTRILKRITALLKDIEKTVSGADELLMSTAWYTLSVMVVFIYLYSLCVTITPSKLFSLPLKQVGGDFCFYLFLFFFK